MRQAILGNFGTDTLSTENIGFQKDVTIIDILTKQFEGIISAISDNDLEAGKAFRNRAVRTAYAVIDSALSKRFGMNFRSVEDLQNVLGIQTTPPKAFNVLSGDVINNYKYINQFITKSKNNIESEDIDVKKANWTKILKVYLQSINAVDKALQTNGITVDLANAKVYGYPTEATVVILTNPVKLIKKAELNAAELTAAYLHEVGHAFSHLEYSYRTIQNTTMLIESLLDEVRKDTPTLEAIKLSYAKTFDDDKISKSTSVVTAAVGVTSKYFDDVKSFGGNTYASKDSERVADQFAARFGLGAELMSGVDKIHTNLKIDLNLVNAIGTGAGVIFVTYVASLIIGVFLPAIGLGLGTLMAAVAGGALYFIIMTFIVYVLLNTVAAVLSRGINTEIPYDSSARRILRIKNELVRQLRTMDLDKQATKAILLNIDTLAAAASVANADNENGVYRLVGKLFKYSDDQNEMRSLDDVVNDLMNNDLHVAATKIAQI